MKKAVKDLFIYILGGGLSRLLPLIILPYVASRFTQTEFGIFSLFQLYLALGSAILMLGLEQAVFRKTSGRLPDQQKHRIMGTALYFITAAGFLAALLSLLFPAVFNQFLFENELGDPVVLVAFFTLLISIDVLFMTKFKAEQKSSRYFYLLMLRSLLFFLLMVVLLESGLRLEAYYIALVASEIVILLLMSGDIIPALRSGFSIPVFRELIRYGFPLFGVSFMLLLIYQFDHYLIKEYFGVEQTGIYAYAYKFAAVISTFILIANNVWMPRLFEKGMSFAQEYLKEYAALMLLIAAFILIVLISAFRLFPDILIPEGFEQTPLLLTVLGIGFLFYAHSHILDSLLLHDNRTVLLAALNFTALVWNVVFNLIFLPIYGKIAAAAITSLSYILLWILIIFTLRRFNRDVNPLKIALEGILFSLPIMLQLMLDSLPLTWLLFALAGVIIIFRHRSFIRRYREL